MFTIENVSKIRRPRIPFGKIADHILGKKYSLSIVFATDALAKDLNKRYRKKNSTSNILSFPLSHSEGEIFLNAKQIRKEAKEHGLSFTKYFAFIFIHGLLHLKGYRHSSRMESEEQRILRRFGLSR